MEALLNQIRTHPPELAAMTTNARGGISRAWLGSVADKVLRGGSRPLLLMNPGG